MQKKDKVSRRGFLVQGGRAVAVAALGATTYRLVAGRSADSDFERPPARYAWRIDPQKCTFCGKCEIACVRKPSAVKAVNDQKKCSNCVVCHGHLLDEDTPTEKIDTEGRKVCPYGAVSRRNFGGDYYIYTIDDSYCVGCGKCAKRCDDDGSQSMFLIIRPDLCLNCNQCNIALECPAGAIERIPLSPEDNYRGEYGLDEFMEDGDFGGEDVPL